MASAAPDTGQGLCESRQDVFANAALELEIPEEELAQMLGTSIPALGCITYHCARVLPRSSSH
jgi:hypothetical protein